MPKVPASILNILKGIPEHQLHTVCSKLRITETMEYKSFVAKNANAKQKHASIKLKAIPIPGAHPPINKNPSIE